MKSKIITSLYGFTAAFALLFGVLAAQPAYAAEVQCSVLPDSFCKAATNDAKGPATSKNSAIFMVLQWAIALLAGLAGVAAIATFVYAGIMYSSASGNAELVKKSKDLMLQTVIGLAAFAVLAVVLTWLIPGGIF